MTKFIVTADSVEEMRAEIVAAAERRAQAYEAEAGFARSQKERHGVKQQARAMRDFAEFWREVEITPKEG